MSQLLAEVDAFLAEAEGLEPSDLQTEPLQLRLLGFAAKLERAMPDVGEPKLLSRRLGRLRRLQSVSGLIGIADPDDERCAAGSGLYWMRHRPLVETGEIP